MPDKPEMSDLLGDDEGPTQRKLFDLPRLRRDMRTYYPLLFVFVIAFLVLAAVLVLLSRPTWTATSLVGPADNSDQPFGTGAGAAGLLSKGGLSGMAKHLHIGGALGGSDDVFDEYVSLLTSSRLAAVLDSKDHVLPEIFDTEWDVANHRWYPRDDFVNRSVDFIKTAVLGRPPKPHPDQDDLSRFLQEQLVVDQSLETGFATVTLKFHDHTESERLLNLILLEADNIIREDKRRDVEARIAYLNRGLARLAIAEEKEELIDILSDQEQEMMMVESDHRYASNLIVPPHAPLKPSSPLPTIDAGIAFLLACSAWLGAVRLTPESGRLRRLLNRFARRAQKCTPSHGAIPAEAGAR